MLKGNGLTLHGAKGPTGASFIVNSITWPMDAGEKNECLVLNKTSVNGISQNSFNWHNSLLDIQSTHPNLVKKYDSESNTLFFGLENNLKGASGWLSAVIPEGDQLIISGSNRLDSHESLRFDRTSRSLVSANLRAEDTVYGENIVANRASMDTINSRRIEGINLISKKDLTSTNGNIVALTHSNIGGENGKIISGNLTQGVRGGGLVRVSKTTNGHWEDGYLGNSNFILIPPSSFYPLNNYPGWTGASGFYSDSQNLMCTVGATAVELFGHAVCPKGFNITGGTFLTDGFEFNASWSLYAMSPGSSSTLISYSSTFNHIGTSDWTDYLKKPQVKVTPPTSPSSLSVGSVCVTWTPFGDSNVGLGGALVFLSRA